MEKRCIRMLGVRQAALSVTHEMRWQCKCYCMLMLLLAYPVEPTATLFIQNNAEKENIIAEKILFTSKPKPSRSHRTHIYRIF